MKNIKAWLLVLGALILVATSVLGTLAYLSDQESLLNTFTMGQVHIKLDEADLDDQGNALGTRTQTGNTYHLIPGQSYVKDPTVTVEKSSEEAYVRMIVTITGYSQLNAIFNGNFLPENFVQGWDRSMWPCVNIFSDTVENTVSYEFRYTDPDTGSKTVQPDGINDLVLPPLFQTIVIPGALDGEDLESLGTAGFAIHVSAYAIQSLGFQNETEAWEAYEANN